MRCWGYGYDLVGGYLAWNGNGLMLLYVLGELLLDWFWKWMDWWMGGLFCNDFTDVVGT